VSFDTLLFQCLVFSDKDVKPEVPSVFTLTML